MNQRLYKINQIAHITCVAYLITETIAKHEDIQKKLWSLLTFPLSLPFLFFYFIYIYIYIKKTEDWEKKINWVPLEPEVVYLSWVSHATWPYCLFLLRWQRDPCDSVSMKIREQVIVFKDTQVLGFNLATWLMWKTRFFFLFFFFFWVLTRNETKTKSVQH